VIVIIEIDRPCQIKPGLFRSTVGGRPFTRVWFLWFGLTHWPGDLREYGVAMRGAAWVNPTLANAELRTDET
tara:strand:- start:17 stop:232 length:216 start_codon:yes stop_codon:yes gene_type:complete